MKSTKFFFVLCENFTRYARTHYNYNIAITIFYNSISCSYVVFAPTYESSFPRKLHRSLYNIIGVQLLGEHIHSCVCIYIYIIYTYITRFVVTGWSVCDSIFSYRNYRSFTGLYSRITIEMFRAHKSIFSFK